jgi:hypothetical protein
MAIIPSPAVNFGPYGNTGTIDPTKYSRTGAANTDPGLFQLMLAQSMNNNAFNILFGNDEDSNNTSIFGSNNTAFGSSSSVFGEDILGNSSASLSSNISNNLSGGTSPALEMIARSGLIGKTVEAVRPGSKETFKGKVESVSVASGILLINVGGVNVPAENLIKVEE